MRESAISEAEKNRRANRVLEDIIDAIETFACVYDSPDPELRMTLVLGLGSLSLSTVLERRGWLAWLRVVIGSVRVRYRYPGTVQP